MLFDWSPLLNEKRFEARDPGSAQAVRNGAELGIASTTNCFDSPIKGERKENFMKILLLISALTLTVALCAVVGKAQEQNALKVDRLDFPVTLSDGNKYTIAGFLYHCG